MSHSVDDSFNSNNVEVFDFKKLLNNQENKNKMSGSEIDDLFNPKPKIVVEDNQMVLQSGKIITFNDQQYEGLNKIRKWLKEKDKPFYTLAGFAGTGKSTIIKKILDNYRGGVVVSAPTHKAVKVIRVITKKEGKTLHSLLGLRVDVSLDSFNPNQPAFAPIAPPKITEYNLCVLDECSMVNSELLDLIKEKIKGSNTKVLFVGDDAQIPPVGQKISKIFIDADIEVHKLTKVERQTDSNPLMFIYDNMRNNLDSSDGGFLRKTNINGIGEGVIFTVDKRYFRESVLKMFLSMDYAKNSDYVKGLAWKNDTVMQANMIVREALIGKNKDIVEKNDVLMGYRSISNERQTYNIIENSADYKVIEKSELVENDYGISGFNIKIIEDLGNDKFKTENVFIVDVNSRENLHIYAQTHDSLRNLAFENKKMWNKYYTFRRNNLLMKNIEQNVNGRYRNSEDIIVKDLDYGYFITTHKSQGSTYQHVMIMDVDINENQNIIERNQIRYVAMSRPAISAHVLSNRIDL